MIGLVMRRRGWAYALMLALGLGFLAFTFSGAVLQVWLAQFGQTVQGRVTDLPIRGLPCAQTSRWACPSYHLRYQFTLDGAEYGGLERLDARWVQEFQQGQRIDVHYLPGNPGVSQAEIGSRLRGTLGPAFLGLIFAVLGGVMLWERLRFAARALQLRAAGQVRPARVMRHVVRGKGREAMLPQARFEWVDTAGDTGTSEAQWRADLPPVGAEIWVHADPQGRLPPVWEGDAPR